MPLSSLGIYYIENGRLSPAADSLLNYEWDENGNETPGSLFKRACEGSMHAKLEIIMLNQKRLAEMMKESKGV